MPILLAYLMAIVVVLPISSKIDFAVVSGIMMAQNFCRAGHQSKKLLQVGSKEQTVRS